MKRTWREKSLLQFVLCVAALLSPAAFHARPVWAGEIQERRISYLQGGELWVCGLDGGSPEQVTRTAGKIEDYSFSVTGKFLAYSRILRWVDEPGIREKGETVPKRAVCSIVIMDWGTRKAIREIPPGKDGWIYISKWLPGDALLYYGASGFDVTGHSLFEAGLGRIRSLELPEAARLSEGDISRSGDLQIFTEESGLGKDYLQILYLQDRRAGRTSRLFARRSVLDPRLSRSCKWIAFLEVEQAGEKYQDILWVFERDTGGLRDLYRGPAHPKSGDRSELDWSPDDRYLGMFFSSEALVVDLQKKTGPPARIAGSDFCWVDDTRIAFRRDRDLYMVALPAGSPGLWKKGASRPGLLGPDRLTAGAIR